MAAIARIATILLVLTSLSACSATFRNHGYVPNESALREITVGRDTRDTVETMIGRPATSGVEGEDAWYYVQEQVRHFAWRAPRTTNRQLVAVSFAPNGTVSNIERFGLERGRVVPLSRRVTETSIREFSLIQQILRNFGRIDVGDALAGADG